MQKNWISLGLMSGTSGDGVDASIINTDGINQYLGILALIVLLAAYMLVVYCR